MKALDNDAKMQAFENFWKKFDPTPETRVNEYMEEYYRRVAIAEKQFKSFKPGWKTQRGMVFIKLGPPDYVNQPFVKDFDPIGRNRQVVSWQYSRLNRQVVFERIGDEYRILNYVDIFDLLGQDGIRF